MAGMSTACFFGRNNVEESIDIMGGMGVRLAEVFLNTLCEFEPAYARELRKRTDDLGMRVRTVHPHGVMYESQLFSRYERSRVDAMDIFKRVHESAAILGAEMTVFHGLLNVKMSPVPLNMERLGIILQDVCGAAEDFGIKISFENVHWCWFKTPGFADELRKAVGEERAVFTLDVKQAAQSGYSFEEYAAHMGSGLKNLHICDYKLMQDGIHTMLPPKGELDIGDLRKISQETGSPAILEVYSNDYEDLSELKRSFDLLCESF